MICKWKTLGRTQKGIAIVEFTIMIPVILLLLYSLAEIGRIQMMSNTLAKTVRDGARHLASNAQKGTTGVVDITELVELQTKNLVVYGIPVVAETPLLDGFSANDVQVNDLGDGLHVSVSASYNFTPIFSPQIPTFGVMNEPVSLAFPLRAAVTMQVLK